MIQLDGINKQFIVGKKIHCDVLFVFLYIVNVFLIAVFFMPYWSRFCLQDWHNYTSLLQVTPIGMRISQFLRMATVKDSTASTIERDRFILWYLFNSFTVLHTTNKFLWNNFLCIDSHNWTFRAFTRNTENFGNRRNEQGMRRNCISTSTPSVKVWDGNYFLFPAYSRNLVMNYRHACTHTHTHVCTNTCMHSAHTRTHSHTNTCTHTTYT